MKIEGGGNNVSYTITKVGFYMFVICKYRTVDVNVLKKTVINTFYIFFFNAMLILVRWVVETICCKYTSIDHSGLR